MTKSPTNKQPPPQQQNNLTKWITRITTVFLLAVTVVWLDGIKVGFHNSSNALTNLNPRVGGMFSSRSSSTSLRKKPSLPHQMTHKA